MKTLFGFYISWGHLNDHNHFAKAGETWKYPWKPSQPHPVRWQFIRCENGSKKRPLVWILWFYPKAGGAAWFEFGWSRRKVKPTNWRLLGFECAHIGSVSALTFLDRDVWVRDGDASVVSLFGMDVYTRCGDYRWCLGHGWCWRSA